MPDDEDDTADGRWSGDASGGLGYRNAEENDEDTADEGDSRASAAGGNPDEEAPEATRPLQKAGDPRNIAPGGEAATVFDFFASGRAGLGQYRAAATAARASGSLTGPANILVFLGGTDGTTTTPPQARTRSR
jgi:hypothetical protein